MPELKRRADGWPLCPFCGEDELGDLVNTIASDEGDLFCYRCATVTVRNGRPVERAPIPGQLGLGFFFDRDPGDET